MATYLNNGQLVLKIWFLDNSTQSVLVDEEDTFQSLLVGLCQRQLNMPAPEHAARYMGLYNSENGVVQEALPLDGKPVEFAEEWDEDKQLVLQLRL